MSLLKIESRGQAIISSNFWDTEAAKMGAMFLSYNAGAARLLLPDLFSQLVQQMKTGEYVIISSDPLNMTELLFEDHSEEPFSIQLGPMQVDRVLPESDTCREDLRFLVYVRNSVLAMELQAKYRKVEKLPCLKPRGE